MIENGMSDEFGFNESNVDAMLVPVMSSKIVPLTADWAKGMYQKLVDSVDVAPPAGRKLPEGGKKEHLWSVVSQFGSGRGSWGERV